MIKLKNYLLKISREVVRSIAFYPTLIGLGGFGLVLVTFFLESRGITEYLLNHASFLLVNNADTARTILSTLIGGLFSLTVFSFSMVMVMLNQASSNFSPRLLPGLVSNSRHQIVLGIYLGSIVFSLFILISVLPAANVYQLPGFSILIAIFLGIICLALFVYFIHMISQEIQIDFILNRIYVECLKNLKKADERDTWSQSHEIEETKDWFEIPAKHSGYFNDLLLKELLSIGKKHDTVFHILPFKGKFVHRHETLIRSRKQLDEEASEEAISCMQFSGTRLVAENYVLGFQQITEIALKAMSPGINDPGTALSAIDYLSQLLAGRMELENLEVQRGKNGECLIYFSPVGFEDLLFDTMAPLRQYCKHDVIIMRKLLNMLLFLQNEKTDNPVYQNAVQKEIDNVLADAKESLQNDVDRQQLSMDG